MAADGQSGGTGESGSSGSGSGDGPSGNEDRAVIWLSGDQDIATAGRIEAALIHAVDADKRDVVIDLNHVEFLDASTIGVLIRGSGMLADHGRRLTVRSPQPIPARVLDLCGLTDLVDPWLRGAMATRN
ncbi:MAG: STAS domain-containing protein [Acidimicrobiales bacterium]